MALAKVVSRNLEKKFDEFRGISRGIWPEIA